MKLSDVKKLHQKKYRTQFGFYLVEGEHLVLELLKAIRQDVNFNTIPNETLSIYVTNEYEVWLEHALSQEAAVESEQSKISPNERVPAVKVERLTSIQMQQLSDTKSPQGIIARVPLKTASSNKDINSVSDESANSQLNQQRYIYLYEVQDPGNLGTILRTLAWFGNFKLLLSPNSVDPFNSKVVRASMGAIFHVDMELNVTLKDLASRFSQFAYLDMHGDEIKSQHFGNFQCYLFGNEARGVPTEEIARLNATAFTITGSGKIDSLNLASAVNICTYELSQ
ncbi:RNA methyltransferase [Alteromonas sp. MB-3u-76]|uniref:TrmH family RNA methyltransferase n=1 Tax=Alteromonas sp. MB-3u-76 TaxID=2058133 RepID=UPI000C30489A|nr:RNA methyltransferase [Alteromonas sp. MB-3u-76]AUC89152.1 RNA methyltransferase [Alteromonas sp. MB-3u-76]